MMNKIKELFNKKSIVDLDNDGKIESYRAEVEGVFAQFKTMRNKLVDVNENLKVVIKDEDDKALQAQKRKEKAEAELQANIKLQEKVEEFVIGD